MDAIVKPVLVGSTSPLSDHVRKAPDPVSPRPSREQAEAAVRTLQCPFTGRSLAAVPAINPDVTTLHARAEALTPAAPFDTVLARAFAPLPQLLPSVASLGCRPLKRSDRAGAPSCSRRS